MSIAPRTLGRLELALSTVSRKFISGILLAKVRVERYICSCPSMKFS